MRNALRIRLFGVFLVIITLMSHAPALSQGIDEQCVVKSAFRDWPGNLIFPWDKFPDLTAKPYSISLVRYDYNPDWRILYRHFTAVFWLEPRGQVMPKKSYEFVYYYGDIQRKFGSIWAGLGYQSYYLNADKPIKFHFDFGPKAEFQINETVKFNV